MHRLSKLAFLVLFATVVFAEPVRAQDDVILPMGAIDATEIQDEPGTSQSVRTDEVELMNNFAVIESSTIMVPTAGYVLAIGSGIAKLDHFGIGGDTQAEFGVSSDCDASPTLSDDERRSFLVPNGAAGGVWWTPFSAQKVFSVSSGNNTLCIVARRGGGGSIITNITLSLLFIPTAYGTVETN